MTSPASAPLWRGLPRQPLPPAPAPGSGAAARAAAFERLADRKEVRLIAIFLLVHPLLATLMKFVPPASTAHALATAALGLYWVLRERTPDKLVPLLGYVVGAEVLWRDTKAQVFWEFGKYSIAALALIALVRFGLMRRAPKLPLFFFLLLIPSVFVMPEFDRRMVAFNLSGPLALALSTCFFATRRLDHRIFQRLLVATLAPILGLAALATFSTVTAESLEFGGSTSVTTAGIGANQVSSVLGLGALLAFFYLFTEKRGGWLRWFFLLVGLWLSAQSALTFSRGGLATFFGAILAGAVFLLRDRRFRGALLVRGSITVLLAAYLLYPALNAVTGGSLERRFTDSRLTGRDKIIQGDWLAFKENPLLGTGPGGSKDYHEIFFRRSSTHTEYTRLLAEHGSFGLAALLILVGLAAARLRRGRASLVSQAFSASMTVWALLYMFHSAMRLAAPALVFGLGAAILLLDVAPAPARAPRPSRPGLLRRPHLPQPALARRAAGT